MSGFVRSKPHTYELLIEGRALYEILTFLVIQVHTRAVSFSVERRFPLEYIESPNESWYRREPEVNKGPTFDSYELMTESYEHALLGQQIGWLGRDELRGKSEQEALHNLMWGLLIRPASTWAKEAAPDWYKRISPYNNSDMETKEEEEGDEALA